MEVTYSVECLPEDTPIRGNVTDSGDPAFDKQVEDEIIAKSELTPWGWCIAKVTASIALEGRTFKGEDYLGGCSYEDEEEFKRDSYYEAMKDQALDDLKETLRESIRMGELAAKALAELS